MQPGFTPRAWQLACVNALYKHMPQHKRLLVSVCTGGGKSDVIPGLMVKAARKGRRSLFVVNRDELIDDVWNRAHRIDSRLYSGRVQGPRDEIDRQAVFASAQTLQKERLNSIGKFDLVVWDEAHHLGAKSWAAIQRKVSEVNPAAWHIGFTATPFRTGPSGGTRGLGEAFDILAYEYSLEDGIRDGVLSPLVCKAVETHLDLTGVDPDDEKALAKLVDTDERNRTVVESYLEHLRGKSAIAFCASIAHAKRLAIAFQMAGVKAEAVWGTDKDRDKKIAAYKEQRIDVITNRDLLCEGFDAKHTHGVLLDRPVQALGLFCQMVGRATRLWPGKEHGLILDFVANSSGLTLASIADLSTPPPSVRITVGCIVRHRRDESLPEGTVVALRDEEQADVIWAGRSEADGVYPCRDLVLLRAARVPDTLVLEPNVIGTSTFTVILFGKEAGRVVGWYQRDSKTYGKVYVTKGKDEAALLIPTAPKSHTWEYWHLAKRWGEKSTATLRHTGHFHECKDRAEAVIDRPQDWNKDWLGDPATEKQLKALHKTGQKLSKGEASMLLEIKYGLMAVKDARRIHG